MASIPPSELPPEPSIPAEPTPAPAETPAPMPDIDVPSPGEPMPGLADPIAGSSMVGTRQPGDNDDIGSTTAMAAATGGMAGSSR